MEEEKNIRNFSLENYKAAKSTMIATNDAQYINGYDRDWIKPTRDYTPEEVSRIIDSGSIEDKVNLSRNYFNKDGFYNKLVLHYANLLCYYGILIPHPSFGQKLSTSHIAKRYDNALEYIDKMKIPTICANFAQRAIVDGCYYGLVLSESKNEFTILDLPNRYCRTRFKDADNNDIIEFDLNYFNRISNLDTRKAILAGYPEFIQKAYKQVTKGKTTTVPLAPGCTSMARWIVIPSELGICFPIFDKRPLLLSVIPATIAYDEAIARELERQAEEIRKIIVQKIPHLTSTGQLLFEPEEAAEMHAGAVGMLKGNKNISVLTSYADVEAIVSHAGADTQNRTTEQMQSNIYATGGTSSQLFNASGSSSMEYSLDNDLSLMMYFAHKFENFITCVINRVCGNSNIKFKYEILPISYYNQQDYVDTSFKLAQYGYPAVLPSIAMGISQRDLVSLKDLENDVYDLANKKLIPLQSANTQAAEGEEAGRPTVKQKDKAEQTVKNETSKDSGGSKQ